MTRYALTLFASLLFLPLPLHMALAQEAVSPHADRETRKLQPRGVEELSAQDLTDIYVGCLSSSIEPPARGGEARMSLGDLRRLCQGERQNLALRFSQQAINELDGLFVSRFNEVARGDGATATP